MRARTLGGEGATRTCRDVVDLLSDYIDGDLAPEVREDFESHMADCAACLEFLDSLRETRDRVRSLRCEEIPPGVHAAFRAFLDRRRKGRRS